MSASVLEVCGKKLCTSSESLKLVLQVNYILHISLLHVFLIFYDIFNYIYLDVLLYFSLKSSDNLDNLLTRVAKTNLESMKNLDF